MPAAHPLRSSVPFPWTVNTARKITLRSYTALLCCALLSLAFTAPGAGSARAETLRTWNIAAWQISANSNDETGRFSHCAASVPYRSGILLLFSVTRDFTWQMGLANPSWVLPVGASYRISYQVDRGPVIPAIAVARLKNLVVVELADSAALFRQFQRGNVLGVRAQGETFLFTLTNSSKVLAATLACAQTYIQAEKSGGGATAANPFGAPPREPAPSENGKTATNPALNAEAVAVTANLLSNAGIQGFHMLDQIPPDLSAFHAIWAAPGLVGGLSIDEGGTVDGALAGVVASETKKCKGRFATAKLPDGDGGVAQVRTACEDPQKNETSVSIYIFAPRSKGGLYLFAIYQVGGAPAAGGNNADDAGSKLMGASSRLLSPRR